MSNQVESIAEPERPMCPVCKIRPSFITGSIRTSWDTCETCTGRAVQELISRTRSRPTVAERDAICGRMDAGTIGGDALGGCGKPVARLAGFRCSDCLTWFHRDCINEHFKEDAYIKKLRELNDQGAIDDWKKEVAAAKRKYDDLLKFFGATEDEEGAITIDMEKYHAAFGPTVEAALEIKNVCDAATRWASMVTEHDFDLGPEEAAVKEAVDALTTKECTVEAAENCCGQMGN